MLWIDPWVYFFAALLILTLPLDWLLAAFIAAGFHEFCHWVVIRILGGRVRKIQIGISGTVMETEIPGKGRELLSAIAGPVGSLLLVALCHVFPKLAICACLQGMFNLLPVFPLDGGRMLHCLLSCICPAKSDKVMKWIETITYAFIILFTLTAAIWCSFGLLPLVTAVLVIIKFILRKRPCKRSQIRVQ